MREEKKIELLEEAELAELKKLEREVKRGAMPHPLTKITSRDVIRGSIGALFGTVGHFAFFYGVEIAENISVARATLLYIISFIVCFVFMYYSGFRKVKEINAFHFMPIRVIVLYVVALAVVTLTLLAFGFLDFSSPFIQIYKTVSTNSLLAVLGAITADIVGKD